MDLLKNIFSQNMLINGLKYDNISVFADIFLYLLF